jgi:hypothetical protein
MLMHEGDHKSFCFKILPINPYYSKILMLSSLQVHCFHRSEGEGGTPSRIPQRGCPCATGGVFESCEREAVSIDSRLAGLRIGGASLR